MIATAITKVVGQLINRASIECEAAILSAISGQKRVAKTCDAGVFKTAKSGLEEPQRVVFFNQPLVRS